ncbi:hypothetical protein IRY55_02505 [Savagea sp. SN6]|uniref:Uncharacterized protein n=1 Tax=Savagea serpentis TaxID=2785297 RepID=A0A8J7G200_9BACL|nr:hypothetical protein [Savagea serpentis]MBF4500222.1 hypothetical protein [Savagea serpentis]
MMNLEKQLKDEFFNNLFVQNNIETKEGNLTRVNKMVITINNSHLDKVVNKIVAQYSNYITKDEVIAEVMYEAMNVIYNFEVPHGSWHNMINGTDIDNLNMLFKKLIIASEKAILEYAYDIKGVSIDGKVFLMSQRFDSLDVPLDYDDIDSGLLVDTVTHSFWSVDDYDHDIDSDDVYIDWFLDNKEEVLTNNQLDFYDSIVFADSTAGYQSNDLAEQIGRDKQNVKRTMENIKKRVDEKFENAKDTERYNLLQQLVVLTDEYEIADWISANINKFTDVLKNNLVDEEYQLLRKTLRRKQPDTDIVYLADEVLIGYYDYLKVLNEYESKQPKKFYKKLSEYSDFNVVEALRKYKEFAKHGEVKVYKNGELIKTQKPKVTKNKNRIINLTI